MPAYPMNQPEIYQAHLPGDDVYPNHLCAYDHHLSGIPVDKLPMYLRQFFGNTNDMS